MLQSCSAVYASFELGCVFEKQAETEEWNKEGPYINDCLWWRAACESELAACSSPRVLEESFSGCLGYHCSSRRRHVRVPLAIIMFP